MATLDVLDYLVKLDEALVGRLGPAERKMARKDVRRTLEDLAFRFAILDERVMPEDLDYARALEVLKEPDATARVLERRAPVYRKRRVRKGITTAVVLVGLALFVGAFSNFVTSERADVLVDGWLVGSPTPQSKSESREFTVPHGTSRLQLSGPVVVLTDRESVRENTVTVLLMDPSGQIRFEKVFTSANAVYAKTTVEVPTPGAWTLLVDFRDAAGSAELTVLGVSAK